MLAKDLTVGDSFSPVTSSKVSYNSNGSGVSLLNVTPLVNIRLKKLIAVRLFAQHLHLAAVDGIFLVMLKSIKYN